MKLNYFVIPLITIIVASVGGAITDSGLNWYRTINLPSWTPTGSSIGLVWTIIFILTTISALIIFNPSKKLGASKLYKRTKNLIMLFFILNALLNVFWSYLFFGQHLIGFAIIDAILLEASVLALIVLIQPLSFFASFLLAPYAVWVIFATYLTFAVSILNR